MNIFNLIILIGAILLSIAIPIGILTLIILGIKALRKYLKEEEIKT